MKLIVFTTGCYWSLKKNYFRQQVASGELLYLISKVLIARTRKVIKMHKKNLNVVIIIIYYIDKS